MQNLLLLKESLAKFVKKKERVSGGLRCPSYILYWEDEKMKIGLLADMLDFGYRGVGVYAYNLISKLLEIDKNNDYIIVHNKNGRFPQEHKDIF